MEGGYKQSNFIREGVVGGTVGSPTLKLKLF
jgi:hypothetical protein